MDARRWVMFLARVAVALAIGIPLFRWATGTMHAGEGIDLNFGTAFTIVSAMLFYAVILSLLFGRSLIDSVANKFETLYTGSDEHFQIAPEYSIAEAQVKKGRYPEAVDEYRKVIVEFPEDIYPHLRIAELAEKHLDDLQLAELELVSALAKAKGEDSTALAAGRLADLYQLKMNDPVRALEIMKQLREKIPDTKQAKLAEERIALLEGIVQGSVAVPKMPDKIAHRPSRYKMSD